jgi:transcriptional regulator with XRE-family HTH domain
MSEGTIERQRRATASARELDEPDLVDVHVGKQLRFRRSMMGMSQAELAAGVGLSFQAVQKYERGENRISASRLHQFAVRLGVPVSYFFESLPGEPRRGELAPYEPSVGLSHHEVHEVLRAFGALRQPVLRRSFLQVMKDAAGALDLSSAGAPDPRQQPRRRRRAGADR